MTYTVPSGKFLAAIPAINSNTVAATLRNATTNAANILLQNWGTGEVSATISLFVLYGPSSA